MSAARRFPLAITGVGLHLPGASTLDELGTLLAERRVVVGPVPPGRLDRGLLFRPGEPTPGKTLTDLGATVPLPLSAPESLGLSPALAAAADPAHVAFVATALEAIVDAGLSLEQLAERRVGVFVGHARPSDRAGDILFAAAVRSLVGEIRDLPELGEFSDAELGSLLAEIEDLNRAGTEDGTANPGLSLYASGAARLLARRIGAHGPCWTVDAACASSLAALFLAQRLIALGQIDMAVVGGCSLAQWTSLVMFSQAGALSATGSFPFDARADGFVSSDGFTAAVVEPLEAADARGRIPYAVLRRIAGACDGRGKSLWAPTVQGQVAALARCYDEEVTTASVQVLEAHCTGTQLGDATEVAAISEVFGQDARADRIPIGSIKGNLGHTRESAGLAGVFSVLAAFRRGAASPTAGYVTPSPAIDWERAPVRVLSEPERWPDQPGQPRRAAVSSMGIGGLDYHAVIDAPGQVGADAASQAKREPVAIVGIGLLHPAARTLTALWQALESAPEPCEVPRQRWRPAEAERWGVDRHARHHALVDWQLDFRRHRLPPRHVELADPTHLMLLEAAMCALEQAGWWPGELPFRRTTAVLVGSCFGSDFTGTVNLGLHAARLVRDLKEALCRRGCAPEEADRIAMAARDRWREHYPVTDEWGGFSPSTLASRLAKHFDLGGPCASLDAEDDASLAALTAAMAVLSAHDCDVALCGGVQRTLGPARVAAYARAGWLELAPALRLADAAVVLVLRRSCDARRDGQRVLAELDDVGQGFEAGDPWVALAQVAKAGRAKIPAGSSAPVVLAGLGLDPVREIAAIAALASGVAPVPVARRLGHAQGASGFVALAAALACSGDEQAKEVPFGAYSIGPDGTAGLALGRAFPAALRGLVAGPPVESARTAARTPARTSCAGQAAGGSTVGAHHAARIVRLAAEKPERLSALVAAARSSPHECWRSTEGMGFSPSDEWRLAVVATSPADLATKLASLDEVPPPPEHWPALHEQGVFLHQRPASRPRLAVLFSGQGSQSAGMLRGLIDAVPAARAALAEVNGALAAVGVAGWEEMVWGESAAERLGRDSLHTQMAVLGGDLAAWAALGTLSVRPDVVAGHSLGELAALVAAGSWSVEQAIRTVHQRHILLAGLGQNPGRLVSTSADPARLATLVSELGERGAWVAVRNSPEQTVLAVAPERLEEVLDTLQAAGEAVQVLPVPLPFHSPLLASVQTLWEAEVARATLAPPRLPFLSWVDATYVSEPAELRRRLEAQNLVVLDFVRVVERLWADGVRVVVEAGPRAVLTRLVRAVLRERPVLAVSVDHNRVPASEQLLRVQALLETQALVASSGTPAQIAGSVPYRLTRSLPAPAREGFAFGDATAARRTRLAGAREREAPRTPEDPSCPPAVPAAPLDELEEALVAFVCDQTGYPREMVGLDQDLEADLGLDSLKKAQMLLEARDRFAITTPVTASGLALGRLATVRDVARLLRELRGAPPMPVVDAPATPGAVAAPMSTADQPWNAPMPPGQTMRRWVMRTTALPAAAAAPHVPVPTLLVGDGEAAAAIAAALRQIGSVVEHDPDSATAARRLARAKAPARRLVLATGLTPEPDWFSTDPVRRVAALQRHGGDAFHVVRVWLAALRTLGTLVGSELVVVSALGGGLGATRGRDAEPAGAALVGLVRALRREAPEVAARVLDVPADEPMGLVARALVAMLARHDSPLELGAARGRLVELRLLAADLPEPAHEELPDALAEALSPGAAWLVTGGGRGITAIASRAMARRWGMQLHIVGRSDPAPLPDSWCGLDTSGRQALRQEAEARARELGRDPEMAWGEVSGRLELAETLAAHREAGVRFTYHQADVTDASALGGVLERVRAAGAPIRGVLHGAGYEAAASIERKREEDVKKTLETKVLGLQHLLALTAGDPLAAVVAFGSAAALWGNHGQTDYALANELMSKLLAARRAATGVLATTVLWPAWGEAGMAARGVGRLSLAAAGRRFLPTQEGCGHLVRELAAGLPEPEVLVFDSPATVPAPVTAAPLRVQLLRHPSSARIALLDGYLQAPDGRTVGGELLLDPRRQPFLADHQLEGVPLLAAAMLTEAMVAAASAGRSAVAPVTVRSFRVRAALRVPFGTQSLCRVMCREQAESIKVELRADRFAANGRMAEPDAVIAEASVSWSAELEPPLATPLDLAATDAFGWHEPEYVPEPARRRHRFWYGVTLRALRRIWLGSSDGHGELLMDDPCRLRPDRPEARWHVPAALLDGCILACGIFCLTRLRLVCLPVGIDELVVTRTPDPGERCQLSFSMVDRGDAEVRLELRLDGTDGLPVLWCRGLRLTPLREVAT